MAFTVTVERYGSGQPSAVESYSEADDFHVREGHLTLLRSGNTLAVYAPGEWRTAHRDETRRFTELSG